MAGTLQETHKIIFKKNSIYSNMKTSGIKPPSFTASGVKPTRGKKLAWEREQKKPARHRYMIQLHTATKYKQFLQWNPVSGGNLDPANTKRKQYI